VPEPVTGVQSTNLLSLWMGHKDDVPPFPFSSRTRVT
jgi:hypothetical protein